VRVRTDVPFWSRFSKRTLRIVLIVAIVLVAARLALPYAVKRYVNKTLNEIPEYQGHVADIQIALWRGAYVMKDVALSKVSGKVPVPLFTAPRVDLSMEWGELFHHHSLVGEIILTEPEVNFVSGPTAETQQTSVDSSFVDRVKELFPFNLNRLEVRNGSIHYRDFHSSPKVDVHMDEMNGSVLHLTNRPKDADELFARLSVEGRPLGHGRFHIDMKLNPLKEPAPFNLAAELQNLQLAKINDMLKAYGDFNVKSGTFSAYTEIESADGRFHGYVKPLFKDVKVLREKHAGLGQKVWDTLVATAAKVLQNQKTDKVATRVNLSGRLDDPKADIWSTIGGLLRNAFIHAIVPGLKVAWATGGAPILRTTRSSSERSQLGEPVDQDRHLVACGVAGGLQGAS